MFLNQEKFLSEAKALVESQFAALNALGGKAAEAGKKAMTLNVATAKAFAEESAAGARQIASAKDPQEFFVVAAAQAKLNADKAAAYGRALSEIVSGVNADFTKAAEVQIADSKIQFAALIDDVVKSAPAGSEKAVALLKSIIGTASAGCDQLTQSAKQAVETAKANVVTATDQLSQLVEQSAST